MNTLTENTLKKVAAVALFVLSVSAAAAQEARYDRVTISRVAVNHGDSYDAQIAADLFNVPQEEQFFYNQVDLKTIPGKQQRDKKVYNGSTYLYVNFTAPEIEARKREITSYLNKNKAGLQQLSVWFNRKEDGAMDMDLVHFRGEYNATDQAFQTVSATKRGRGELKDMGEALIANTYFLVYDYAQLRRTSEQGSHGYTSTVYLYVYRIAAPDKAVNAVYDCWIDEGDSPQVRKEKMARFDNLKVDVEFVGMHRAGGSASGASSGSNARSASELLTATVKNGYANAMAKLVKNDSRFAVQTPIYSVRPITAKIGRKEGLRTSQRYYVYESVMKRDNKIVQQRKGVVRADAGVVDNRRITDGRTPPSRFFQIAGHRVEPGMTLMYRDDLGFSVVGAYQQNVGSQLGGQLRVEWLAKVDENPGWYLYADVEAMSFRSPDTDTTRAWLLKQIDYSLLAKEYVLSDESKSSFFYYRFSFGVGRSYYPLRNLQVSPYAGLGFGSTNFAALKDSTKTNTSSTDNSTSSENKDISLSVSSWHAKVGVNVTLNIYYPLQLVGGVYAHAHTTAFSASTDKDEKEKDEKYIKSDNDPYRKLRDFSYSDYFSGQRAVGIVGFVGVRYNF